jgi:hypothetical protein
MTTNTDESAEDEIVFDAETENGEELNLTSSQREMLTRAGELLTTLRN